MQHGSKHSAEGGETSCQSARAAASERASERARAREREREREPNKSQVRAHRSLSLSLSLSRSRSRPRSLSRPRSRRSLERDRERSRSRGDGELPRSLTRPSSPQPPPPPPPSPAVLRNAASRSAASRAAPSIATFTGRVNCVWRRKPVYYSPLTLLLGAPPPLLRHLPVLACDLKGCLHFRRSTKGMRRNTETHLQLALDLEGLRHSRLRHSMRHSARPRGIYSLSSRCRVQLPAVEYDCTSAVQACRS